MDTDNRPTDYQDLWLSLRRHLREQRLQQAVRAAQEKDIDRIRRYQGAYGFVAVIEGLMEMLESAQHGDEEAAATLQSMTESVA